jgi:hypothetical protein
LLVRNAFWNFEFIQNLSNRPMPSAFPLQTSFVEGLCYTSVWLPVTCTQRALSLFNFSSFPDCCFQAFILTSVGTEKGLISLHCPVSPHCMGALYLCARCISVISRSRAPPPMTAHEVGPRIRFEWNYWLCIYNKIYRLVLISMQFGSVKDLLHLIRIQVYYYVYRLSPLPGFV